MGKLHIIIPIEIDEEDLKAQLCSALEGGSNYWYMIERVIYAKGVKASDFAEGGKYQGKTYWHPYTLIPFVKGCALVFSDREEGDNPKRKRYTLTLRKMIKGLQLMAQKYPKHFADVTGETGDADTGDVFLQLSLFGGLVFG